MDIKGHETWLGITMRWASWSCSAWTLHMRTAWGEDKRINVAESLFADATRRKREFGAHAMCMVGGWNVDIGNGDKHAPGWKFLWLVEAQARLHTSWADHRAACRCTTWTIGRTDGGPRTPRSTATGPSIGPASHRGHGRATSGISLAGRTTRRWSWPGRRDAAEKPTGPRARAAGSRSSGDGGQADVVSAGPSPGASRSRCRFAGASPTYAASGLGDRALARRPTR